MNIVLLNKEEATEAAIMGVHRRMTNLFCELKDLGHHGPPIGGSWWSNDIEAVNTFNAPDVGDGWQVRYTDWENGCLILRKKDKPKLDQKFVLVTGSMPKYCIRGYIIGRDGVKQKYIKNPHNGKKALFIPQSDLIKF
jgi:hypothetical protein